MKKAKYFPTTIVSGVQTEADDNGEPFKGPYTEFVGVLSYIANTVCPDILFAVGNRTRFSAAPRQLHWSARKRVVRYLNSTKGQEITLKP